MNKQSIRSTWQWFKHHWFKHHWFKHHWFKHHGQKHIRRSLSSLILVILGITFSLLCHFPVTTIATPAPAHTLIEQGRDFYQTGRYQEAATRLEQALQTQTEQGAVLNRALTLSYLALTYQQLGQIEIAQQTIATSLSLLPATNESEPVRRVRAQVWNTQGRLQLAWGRAEAAIESWHTAIQAYRSLNDTAGEIGSQINQLQALRSLGFYQRAKQQIKTIQNRLADQSDLQLKTASLQNLGEILLATGALSDAQTQFTASLALAQQLSSAQTIAISLLSLGNIEQAIGRQSLKQPSSEIPQSSFCSTGEITDQALQHFQAAIDYYQQSAAQAPNALLQTQATLNRLSIQTKLQQPPSIAELDTIATQLNQLPPSRASIYAKVNFAKTLLCFNEQSHLDQQVVSTLNLAERTLQIGIQQAERLADRRAHSYALGHLGQLHRYQGDRTAAQQELQTALSLAKQIRADDIAYQWHWQLGQIFRDTGNRSQALDFYQGAFTNLQALRRDLVVLNADIQFSFRESVEPIYRQFVELLLQNPSQDDLVQARNAIEALQLAELDNFFRDACSDAEPEQIDQVARQKDPSAAIFYPIILPNRLEVILTLPQQDYLDHYTIDASATTVNTVLADLRRQLVEPYTVETVKQPAAQVYDWLIRPVADRLERRQVKTLVFVLDGAFRNVPMTALYDGDRYLIENYAVVLTPGLQLLDPEPLQQFQVNALTGGLSEARANFAALPNVETELQTVKAIIPTPVELLNADFIEPEIAQAIGGTSVSIVHLATHGRFSSQAEETFILTYDDEININELESLLRGRGEDRAEKIELLVLSACETASGDDRAALGLAGVAVRAGARSTLASLWKADDQSTAHLISEFYRQIYLNPSRTNKAIALRNAQLSILHDPNTRHPRYWAAFVLLGNWL